MRNNKTLSEDEILSFIKSNLDKMPVSYLLLKPYEVSKYNARLTVDDDNRLKLNIGVFYKPISGILNE